MEEYELGTNVKASVRGQGVATNLAHRMFIKLGEL